PARDERARHLRLRRRALRLGQAVRGRRRRGLDRDRLRAPVPHRLNRPSEMCSAFCAPEAARQAITETATRERRRAGPAAEAAALMRDPAYVAEAREVAALLEELRGPR